MGYRTVTLPDLGEGVARAEVVEVLVSAGDEIAEDQTLAEVESDKATVQIPAPCSGVVDEVLCAAGSRLSIGDAILRIQIEGPGEAEGDPAPLQRAAEPAARKPGPTRDSRVRAAPRTRALAAELRVDLDASFSRGALVRESDVRAIADGRPETRSPIRGVRREIAERLTEAALVPTVTLVEEADFSKRRQLRGYEQSAWTVRILCEVLAEHPLINSTLEDGAVVTHDVCHVAWAVQTKRGLLAPVIRDAHTLSQAELTTLLRQLIRGARGGSLEPQDLRGGTISITDAGRLGGLFATPLLNLPQTAIVGIHRVAARPVIRDGEVTVGITGFVSCTFDHRAYDGAEAGAFLADLVDAFADA